jgi:hypothetical protein
MMTSYLKVRPSNLREYMRVAIFNTLTSFTNNVIVCLEFLGLLIRLKDFNFHTI